MLLLLEKEEEETRAETTHLSNFDNNCKGAALGTSSNELGVYTRAISRTRLRERGE